MFKYHGLLSRGGGAILSALNISGGTPALAHTDNCNPWAFGYTGTEGYASKKCMNVYNLVSREGLDLQLLATI